jgi:hypothetical protein
MLQLRKIISLMMTLYDEVETWRRNDIYEKWQCSMFRA